MMRILLFLGTNLAIMLVLGVVLSVLGVGNYMQAGGGINLTSLLIFCGVFGMGGSLISLMLSKWMAKKSMGVQIIDQPQNAGEQWIVSTVKELADKAGIGMPEVGIFHSDAPNAFATGASKNNALVAVSTGLLQRMDKEQVKAVLGHEIGHIANGDMVTLALMQGVLNTFVMFFARIIVSVIDSFTRDENGEGGLGFLARMGITIVMDMLLGILASMMVAWFSRRREYRADQAGAELVSPAAMAGALAALKQTYDQPSDLQGELVAFGIRGEGGGLSALMASHPPLDDRINALKQRYGN
ncbi:protease HtpX [Bacterioplanoides sp. SCSIO 12839]|uniref:protease HtpX n=1 Tax=Bacterioplanoides sp. SCSIO 12839 TaxID=2829569 RepID=UPI002106EDDA|nr:protease HtpX [Bacterioplanoides sp. SCSIO 12839]UTW48384.1 protease HtpX [Bacterioplanoides sp. SCSIO 12839]